MSPSRDNEQLPDSIRGSPVRAVYVIGLSALLCPLNAFLSTGHSSVHRTFLCPPDAPLSTGRQLIQWTPMTSVHGSQENMFVTFSDDPRCGPSQPEWQTSAMGLGREWVRSSQWGRNWHRAGKAVNVVRNADGAQIARYFVKMETVCACTCAFVRAFT